MSTLDERIVVSLACADGRVVGLDVRSSRLTNAARAFEGRAASQALALCPLLFPVCGVAHSTALARACESALGLDENGLEAARDLRITAERTLSHAMQVVVAFAEALGEVPDVRGVARLRAAADGLDDALGGGEVPGALGAPFPAPSPADLVDAAAQLSAAARTLTEDLPEDPDAVARWAAAGETVAARLVARAAADPLARLGDTRTAPLGRLDGAELERLFGTPASSRRPTVGGTPRDPSSFTTFQDAPVIAGLRSRFGDGLVPRFVAQLVALRGCAQRVMSAAEAVAEQPAVVARAAPATHPGRGIAVVDTARGPLFYRVRIARDEIVEASTVAPTEWAFHPDGPISSLIGLDERLAEEGGELLVAALDPCVPTDVVLGNRAVDELGGGPHA